MKVADIMTQEVVTVKPDATVQDAAALMLKEQVSGLPVIDNSRHLVGMITEADFLRRVELGTERKRPRWLEFMIGPVTLAAEYVQARGHYVADVMTREVAVASEEMTLADAVALMEKRKVKRLPVVRGDRVVGILTRANLVRALASLPVPTAVPNDDRKIRESVLAELAGHSWNARLGQVTVKDGVVEVWGFIADERQRSAIRVAAEGVAGVKAVHDHLSLFEPFIGIVVAPGPESLSAERRDGAQGES